MSELVQVRIAEARTVPGFRPTWRAATAEPSMPEPSAEQEEDSFAKGYRQGFAEAESAFSGERERMAALLAACEALQPQPSEEVTSLIAEIVDRLVRITVGEAPIDAALLLQRASRAAALVVEADSARTLHLHPDDLALLDPDTLPLAAVADPGLPRGSLRIEDSVGWVEDGIAIYLEALREQLGLGSEDR